MIPFIGHYDLHWRDRLCDVARGTPFVAMHVLQGWQRVDQTIKPTVPRGIVEGLLDASLLEKVRRRAVQSAALKAVCAALGRGHLGARCDAASVDFSKRGGIQTALKNTLAMVQGQAKTSNTDLGLAQLRLLPTRAALDFLATKLAQQQ